MEDILQKARKKYDYVGPISEGMIAVGKEKGKELFVVPQITLLRKFWMENAVIHMKLIFGL